MHLIFLVASERYIVFSSSVFALTPQPLQSLYLIDLLHLTELPFHRDSANYSQAKSIGDMAESIKSASRSKQLFSGSENNSQDELKSGKWTLEEDKILRDYVTANGARNWNLVCKESGLKRSAPSCRHRWNNYLKPNLKQGVFSKDEKELIVKLQDEYGNNWSLISTKVCIQTKLCSSLFDMFVFICASPFAEGYSYLLLWYAYKLKLFVVFYRCLGGHITRLRICGIAN